MALTAREVLITLHLKFQGNWEQILKAMKHQDYLLTDIEQYKTQYDYQDYVCWYDENYPTILRGFYRPPFVLTVDKVKQIKEIAATIDALEQQYEDEVSQLEEFQESRAEQDTQTLQALQKLTEETIDKINNQINKLYNDLDLIRTETNASDSDTD